MIDPVDPGPAFRIGREAEAAAIAWALSCLPNEACGLLAGRGGEAIRFFPVESEEKDPASYRMEGGSMIRAMRAIREAGLDWNGIFHSHVSSEAKPSRTDIALAAYPEPAYVIASLADPARPRLRAFRIRGGAAEEIPVVRP